MKNHIEILIKVVEMSEKLPRLDTETHHSLYICTTNFKEETARLRERERKVL
jgi:hypothetical protein